MIDVVLGPEILVDLLEIPEVVADADDAHDVLLLGFLDDHELLDGILCDQTNMGVCIE
jgi:hypothetical protein